MIVEAPHTDSGLKDGIREVLTFLESNVDNLTDIYFTQEDRDALRGQVRIWRWYI